MSAWNFGKGVEVLHAAPIKHEGDDGAYHAFLLRWADGTHGVMATLPDGGMVGWAKADAKAMLATMTPEDGEPLSELIEAWPDGLA